MRVEELGTNPAAGATAETRPLRIVHCFRAPVGGLFRHVRDLAEAQQGAGHRVGVICDSITGGAFEEDVLAGMAPSLALGLKRLPMRRQVSPSDIAAGLRLMREVRVLDPDILHGHGAKGGAYARVIGTLLRASGTRVARIYSPHGGSLHYDPGSLSGRAYFAAERGLEWMTDAFVFVSQFEADAYAAKVGKPFRPATVVRNGLRPEEFDPIAPSAEARDFLFIGTLRDLKGPDVFIEAMAAIARAASPKPTAFIVGDGSEKLRYEAIVRERRLADAIAFRPSMPARDAFALARTVVVPSRAESMPYIVLEAIAAGMPLIATRVGGIPEILGDDSSRLVAPGDAAALAETMAAALAAPADARAAADLLRDRVRQRFSVAAMARDIEAHCRRRREQRR
jgi:glycosyltransferase involved in cell wall biosynthesis